MARAGALLTTWVFGAITFVWPGLLVSSDAQDPGCLNDPVCPEWVTTYDGPAHAYDRGISMVTSPDGSRVYVTGASNGTSSLDFATIAYDASTAQQLWVARYDGPTSGSDAPFAFGVGGNLITISKDGATVLITGSSAANGKNSYVTIAYNAADGSQLWVSNYSTPQDSQATSLILSADSQRLYVTGFSAVALAAPPAPSVANYDFGTVAYDTATGAELWVARYEGPAGFWDVPYAIGVGNVRQPDGTRREQLFVTGRSNGASSDNSTADFATVAYDALTGSQIWVARYDGPGHDRDLAYALGVSPDGSSVFVTGESAGSGTGADYAIACYDAVTGAQRWVARYDNGSDDLPLYLAISPTGERVAITGFSVNPIGGIGFTPLRDAATIVYDAATGGQVWLGRHSEVDGAAATRVIFSRDGRRLYVAGLENGNVVGVGGGGVGAQVGHSPAIIFAYDAALGGEIWASHYLGPAGDEGNFDLTISPDDAHVFVTGGGQSNAADVTTQSYATGATTPPPVSLLGATSTKIHGAAGAFDLDLPLSGTPGVECRSGGPNGEHTIVFNFARPLTSVATARITWGNGSVKTSTIDSDDAHKYAVHLTGVSNGQVITVTLANVYDSAGNSSQTVSVSMAVLLGDVTGNEIVSNTDVAAVKAEVAAPVTQSNFRNDVNANGVISNTDVSATKAQVGTSLP